MFAGFRAFFDQHPILGTLMGLTLLDAGYGAWTGKGFVRKNDIRVMVANPAKAAEVLNWKFETSMSQLAERMVKAEVDRLGRSGAYNQRTILA